MGASIGTVNIARAQSTISGEVQLKNVKADSSYKLDPWILPETINVYTADSLLAPSFWEYNSDDAVWRYTPPDTTSKSALLDSVTIRYQKLPLTLKRSYAVREVVEEDTSYSDPDEQEDQRKVAKEVFTDESLFGDVDIDRNGSLTRGITVGSNRDLSLESGLRFDLNGNLTDDLEISASLTDESTPIQPDGSTQNLREFDEVFIELRSPKSNIQLGDVDISLTESEFAQVNRRLQGVQAGTQTEVGDYKGAFSVARGRFRTEQFNGQDGVRGPYRLQGENNNQFITVLAGTERVYIDGELMQRGQENDYVIDYGLGEIEFTKERIITDQTRIVVDYQFIEQDFTRTLLAADGREENLLDGKLSVGATVIREADSDNLQASFGLSDSELNELRLAGDSSATVSGADSVGFSRDADFLLYAKVDTVFSGEQFEIFKHIPGDSSGVFRVRFRRLGEGEGSYRRVGQASNGILFEWVGPGRGAYEPFRELPAPEKQQMVAFETRYRPTKKLEIFGEIAGSSLDQNRFSPIDDDDNFDQAYNAGFKLKEIETNIGTFRADVRQRFTGRKFEFFDRSRPVEFDRRWNITGQIDNNKERITEANAGLTVLDQTDIVVSGGLIDRDDMEGNRQQVKITSNQQGYPGFNYQAERIDSENFNINEDGKWLRQIGSVDYDIETSLGTFSPILGFETERREQDLVNKDSLTANSLSFWDLKPGLKYKTGDLTLGFNFSIRDDNRPIEGVFEDQSISTTQNYTLNYKPSSNFNTKNRIGFRNRDFSSVFENRQNATDTKGVLIRSTTNYGILKRVFSGQLFYEANTQREAILQETFIEVGTENGQFTWEDTNGDGVQQIDEFFQEQTPNEGTFVKQFIPSDELFPVIDLETRWRNRIRPALIFKDDQESFWANTLRKIELNSVVEIRETNRTENISDIYLLQLSEFRDDSTTIQGRLFWQQEIKLFPENRKTDISLQSNKLRSLNQRSAGVEQRETDTYILNASYRLKRRYIIKNKFTFEQKESESERLVNRNFDIQSFGIEPGLDFIINRSFQTGLEVEFTRKTDRQPDENVDVNFFKISSNTRAFLFNKVQTSAQVGWQNVNIDGNTTTFGAFELTGGAGRGSTFNWSVQSSYRISQLIRASLNYNGRTVQDRGLVQTMRVTVSAVF